MWVEETPRRPAPSGKGGKVGGGKGTKGKGTKGNGAKGKGKGNMSESSAGALQHVASLRLQWLIVAAQRVGETRSVRKLRQAASRLRLEGPSGMDVDQRGKRCCVSSVAF